MPLRNFRRQISPMQTAPVPGFNPGPMGQVSAKALAGLKLPEYWVMFDTLILSANAVAPASAAVNFANWSATTTFFDSRTVGNATEAITSMNNKAYVDHPFKAYGCAVEVWCDIDAVTASAQATASAFVETVVSYCSLVLKFGGDTKLIAPVSDLPAGGGVVYGSRTDTRAAGANQLAGGACNGLQAAYARCYFPDPIYFKAGPEASFSVNLVTAGNATHGAVARIQALAALTGELEAGVRVKFWGYRGKGLLPGASANN